MTQEQSLCEELLDSMIHMRETANEVNTILVEDSYEYKTKSQRWTSRCSFAWRGFE